MNHTTTNTKAFSIPLKPQEANPESLAARWPLSDAYPPAFVREYRKEFEELGRTGNLKLIQELRLAWQPHPLLRSDLMFHSLKGAVEKKNLELVGKLLELGVAVTQKVTSIALELRDWEMVKLLSQNRFCSFSYPDTMKALQKPPYNQEMMVFFSTRFKGIDADEFLLLARQKPEFLKLLLPYWKLTAPSRWPVHPRDDQESLQDYVMEEILVWVSSHRPRENEVAKLLLQHWNPHIPFQFQELVGEIKNSRC